MGKTGARDPDSITERYCRIQNQLSDLFKETDPGKISDLEHRVRCLEKQLRDARDTFVAFGAHKHGCESLGDKCSCGFAYARDKVRGLDTGHAVQGETADCQKGARGAASEENEDPRGKE